VRICRTQPSASAAHRLLFSVSRNEKKNSNDPDRLLKYLDRFGLRFGDIAQGD
jgi:transcriptional regulatory protein RtcR